jgi:hypothetical protein
MERVPAFQVLPGGKRYVWGGLSQNQIALQSQPAGQSIDPKPPNDLSMAIAEGTIWKIVFRRGASNKISVFLGLAHLGARSGLANRPGRFLAALKPLEKCLSLYVATVLLAGMRSLFLCVWP